MEPSEIVQFAAGPDQAIVLYRPTDVSSELDPHEIFSRIAADAAARAERGEWIVSMTAMPLRHAGALLGNDGSGYQTKVAIAVVYGRIGREAPTATG